MAVQYRPRLLCSPAPLVRPVHGPWPLHLVDELIPARQPHLTERMRFVMRCFLHAMIFGADKLGRPVSHPSFLLLWCLAVV